MARFARMADNVVAEVLDLPTDIDISDAMHPDIVSRWRPCPAEVEQGWIVAGDGFSAPPSFVPAPVDLVATKASLKAMIDAQAEAERLKYITPGAGQAMEYQQAAAEAAAYLAAEHTVDPPAGTYPMLEASVGLDGETLAEVASVVATMNRQWQALGSAIRTARLAAKQAIDLAETAEAARGVTVVWPTPEI